MDAIQRATADWLEAERRVRELAAENAALREKCALMEGLKNIAAEEGLRYVHEAVALREKLAAAEAAQKNAAAECFENSVCANGTNHWQGDDSIARRTNGQCIYCLLAAAEAESARNAKIAAGAHVTAQQTDLARQAEIERDLWKAEAMAARLCMDIDPADFSQQQIDAMWKAYSAARAANEKAEWRE